MLEIVQSNRLEPLADALVARLLAEPPAPFAREPVVVPSAAVGRWLGLRLARSPAGIAAGIDVPFAAAYVWSLFAAVLPELPRRSPFDPRILQWRLARLLARERRGSEFAPVRHYLAGGDVARRVELARALASVFDAYAAYRPKWLERWLAGERAGRGEHEAWQATLWRELAADPEQSGAALIPRRHPKEAFFERLRDDLVAREKLPPRLAFFAVDALAPLYLEVVQGLARHLPVTLYILNPCAEYWGLVVPPATVARAEAAAPERAAYLEIGNPLLAALGMHSRDFIDELLTLEAASSDRFVEPAGDTLLARLQRDVLALVDRPGPDAPRLPLAPHDRSVEIHVCHGPIREAEVLHDQLLARFEAMPDLEPEDVLVLCPDLEAYASAIDAVFAAAPRERFIPYGIAEAAGRTHRLARSLFAIVECALGRLGAEAVARLLDEPAVARRFGIRSEDLPRVRRWIGESGIRWGADEQAAESLGLPPRRDHTWAAGLDRIVIGAALAPEVDAPVAGVLPYPDVEGAATLVAGGLVDLVESLAGLARDLARPRSIAAWRHLLQDALESFHAIPPEEVESAQALRAALGAIAEDARLAAFDEAVPAAVFLEAAHDAVAALERPAGFMRGGITVAPLRSGAIVPARVVCILGLNDAVFPGRDPVRGFDLIAAGKGRRGDRRRRDEDRHAFLGALLAARDAFLVTYTGRGVRDDKPIPPSVVLDELARTVSRGFTHASGDAARAIERVHPLAAFSPRYFAPDRDAAGLRTYAAEWEPGATAEAAAPFASGATCLPAAPASAAAAPARVSLAALVAFLSDPSRDFLRDRLGIALREAPEPLESNERFALDGLERYDVTGRLLDARLAGAPIEPLRRALDADGRLPAGPIGEAAFKRELERASALAAAAREALGADYAPLAPIEVSIALDGATLEGTLDRVAPSGQLVARGGSIRAAQWLDAWVHHLALNAQPPGGAGRSTFLVGYVKADRKTDVKAQELPPLAAETAVRHLADLVALFLEGRGALVPFHREAAFAYCSAIERGRPDPLAAAERAWTAHGAPPGGTAIGAESERPYVALAVRDDPQPLGERFQALAKRVFGPMFAAQSKPAVDEDEEERE